MDVVNTTMNEQYLIPALAALTVVAIGGAIMLLRWTRREPLQQRLRGLHELGMPSGSSATAAVTTDGGITQVLGSIGTVMAGGGSLTLRQQLTQAGYNHARASAIYFGAKLSLLIIGLGIAVMLLVPANIDPRNKLIFAPMCAAIFFFIPNMVVSARRASRCAEIRKHLPDAIDLLEICASAGMGLDMAWNSVADEVRAVSPNLADEMALTNLEIHLGAPRANAIRHMAQRTGAEELSSLVAVLVQSERFGTSVSDALRVYATSMREGRSQMAQESAEKLAVKLIFPMVLFIFPAVVMVMAGPGFMMLYHALKAH